MPFYQSFDFFGKAAPLPWDGFPLLVSQSAHSWSNPFQFELPPPPSPPPLKVHPRKVISWSPPVNENQAAWVYLEDQPQWFNERNVSHKLFAQLCAYSDRLENAAIVWKIDFFVPDNWSFIIAMSILLSDWLDVYHLYCAALTVRRSLGRGINNLSICSLLFTNPDYLGN